MTDKVKRQAYLTALKEAIWNMHGAKSVHVQTMYVLERFKGQTVWDGDVEVFDLIDHPKAKRAYAWAHLDGPNDTETRFWAVLELPPVKDAKTAVQAATMADSKRPQS